MNQSVPFTKDEFLGESKGSPYAEGQWRVFAKMTPEHRAKIERLKQYEGKQVLFTVRGKREIYTVEAVMLKPGDKVWHGETFCSSWPYDFRLRKGVGIKQPDANGFWTRNIDAVENLALEELR